MKLIRGLSNLDQCIYSCVVTIGNFDGLHLAHQQLVKNSIAVAKKYAVPSVFMTFEPLSSEFFSKEPFPRLMRFRDKWEQVAKYGADYFFCIRFNKNFIQITAEDFVKNILVDRLGVKAVVVGENFHFGAKRAGDCQLLQQMGERYHFEVIPIPTIMQNGERVSSSRVRSALLEGKLDVVHRLLGRPYSLWGKVVQGDKRGTGLGFPTANIYLHRKLAPLTGVYVVQVRGIDEMLYQGVANIGTRPTFQGTQVVLEVHLFNFEQNIYGYHVEVEFLHKLRDEKRFETVEALVIQITKDVEEAKSFRLRK